MSNFKAYQSQIIEEVVSKFREAGALSKETAMSLDDLNLFPRQNPEHKIGLHYLKGMRYVRKVKNSFYLDQDALSNPTKTLLRRFVVLFFILFSVMMLTLAIIVFLHEYSII
jgi:hypothetical protein